MAETEIGGTAYFKVGGVAYNTRVGTRIKLGGPVRTPVMGADGQLHGWTTRYMPGEVTIVVSTGGQFSMATLLALTNTTCTLELGNGKTYVVSSGFLTEDRKRTPTRAASRSRSAGRR